MLDLYSEEPLKKRKEGPLFVALVVRLLNAEIEPTIPLPPRSPVCPVCFCFYELEAFFNFSDLPNFRSFPPLAVVDTDGRKTKKPSQLLAENKFGRVGKADLENGPDSKSGPF